MTNTLESDNLTVPCHFRADGIYCAEGYLRYTVSDELVQVEGEPVTCAACEGEGDILTEKGKKLATFYERVWGKKVEAKVREIIDEMRPLQ